MKRKVTHEQDVENFPKRRKRENLPKHATIFLKKWLSEHLNYAYPTTEEKYFMLEQTGLKGTQLNDWFINARRRYAPDMLRNSGNHIGAQNRNTPVPVKRSRRISQLAVSQVPKADTTEIPSTSGSLVVPVVLLCSVSSPVQPYAHPEATRPLAAPSTTKGYGNDSNCCKDVGHTAATASSAGITQSGPFSSISAQVESVPQKPFSAMYILGLVCGQELEKLEHEAKQKKSLHA